MDGSGSQNFRAVIVGLGKIGFSLDQHLDKNAFIFSHTSALLRHSRFELVAGIDSDPIHRKAFSDESGRPSFSSLQEFSKSSSAPLDLIVLAVPSENHHAVFEQCIELNPRMILVEKPLALDLQEAEEMIASAKKRGIRVVVNYIRRFEPAAIQIKERIEKSEIGKIQKIVVWYSKGLFNNASHFIDLMDYWLLRETEKTHGIQILEARKSFHLTGDWDPDFRIMFGSVPVYFLALDENFYSVREIEIYGEKGAFFYHRGGLEIEHRGISENSAFKGYKFLNPIGDAIPSDLNRYQYHVVSALAKSLDTEAPLVSSGDTALKTMEVVEKVRELCQKIA